MFSISNKHDMISRDEYERKISELQSQNQEYLYTITQISSQWNQHKEKTKQLVEKYKELHASNLETEKALKESKAKVDRLEIFLNLTEKARSNLEIMNRELVSTIESHNKALTESGEVSVSSVHDDSYDMVVEQNVNSLSTSGTTTVTSTTSNSVVPSSIAAPMQSVVLIAKLNSALHSNKELVKSNEEDQKQIKQLKNSILRLHNRLGNEERFKQILEKRIQVMQESGLEKLSQIDCLTKAIEESHEIVLAHEDVMKKQGIQLDVATCNIQSLQMCKENLLMELEDAATRQAMLCDRLRQCELKVDRLVEELASVKRENPKLLAELKYDIHLQTSQRNYWEAKCKSISRDLQLRLNESRKILKALGGTRLRLEEAVNERNTFKAALADTFKSMDLGSHKKDVVDRVVSAVLRLQN